MSELIAATAYFIFVFFKAFQQRNVAFMHYRWILPISYCMAVSEVAIISLVAYSAVNADNIWQMAPMAFAIGTGGGLGAVAAMWVHDRYIK